MKLIQILLASAARGTEGGIRNRFSPRPSLITLYSLIPARAGRPRLPCIRFDDAVRPVIPLLFC
ncbi:hypothetical protein C4D60_Mb06t10330 [Musa balbisiana]|uniref:Uncharacterized protein n=1 Tax=Musa balbisiana TaxID=52838 RepID=A0A4S8IM65_MUSBA|nr:hypothetical protein C4D60_Mb06t10330 [Musa balbisiana]